MSELDKRKLVLIRELAFAYGHSVSVILDALYWNVIGGEERARLAEVYNSKCNELPSLKGMVDARGY